MFGGQISAQLLAPEKHPSLLFTADEIPQLRERIGREPYATWWQTIVERIESPPLEYRNDRAKVRQAKSLAFAYLIEGGQEHAREAVKLLREVKFPPRGGDMGEPHLEGDVVGLYAMAYDMLDEFLLGDPDAREDIREILAEEADRLYRGVKIDLGFIDYRLHNTPHLDNWHLRVYGGLGLAAWALADHEGIGGMGPRDWAGRAFEMVTRTLDFQIESADGGFAEGPFYARYAADLYLPYLLALKKITTIDLFADPKVQRMHTWSLNLRLPNGRRPNIEDGHIDDFYGHYLAAVDPRGSVHRWDWENNDLGLYVLKYSEMDAISFFDDQVVAYSPDWGPTVFMPGAGDAVFRSDWSADATYMLLRGEHGRARERGLGHEHPDETSFILYAGREMLALDAGYINFPNHHKVNQGRNHNLVLINGEGPPLFLAGDTAIGGGNDAYLENFYTTPFMDYAEIRARYAETDLRRRVMFPGKEYFVVADQLSAENENHYEWRLHGNGGGTSGGTYDRSDNIARWIRDQAELVVFLPEREGRVFTERDTVHSFSYSQELTHTVLQVQERGWDAEFLAVLFPRSFDRPVPAFYHLQSRGGQAVEVEAEDWRDRIWLLDSDSNSIEFETSIGTLTSDARMGLLRYERSQLQALTLQEVEHLALNGEPLLESVGPVDISLALLGEQANGFVRGNENGYKLSVSLGRALLGVRYGGASVSLDEGQTTIDLSGEGDLVLNLGPGQVTAVVDSPTQPANFELVPNWPNPFNSSTQISYILDEGGEVRVDIYDLLGQRVKSLVAGYQMSGSYQISWDGQDQHGNRVGTGVYLLRLASGSRLASQKLLLLH